MKGYFSNIARQSGLRITGQGGAAQRAGDQRAPSPEPLAPIERKETVMVPPTLDTRSDKPKTSAAKKAQPKEPIPEIKQGKQDKKEAEPIAKLPDMPSAPEPIREEVKIFSHEEIPAKAENAKVNSDKLPSERVELPAIEETVLVNSPVRTDKQQTRASDSPDLASKEPEKKPERNYFAKTAEIIGGREVEPQEVQTILLHEIQEWITAGEQAQDINPSIESQPIEVKAIEINETTAQMDEPELEPGVVRIGQKRRDRHISPETQYESPEAPNIQEQSFDLSIGTISVVIEGDEKTLQPAAAPQAQTAQSAQNTRQDSSRFSRLRRSFL